MKLKIFKKYFFLTSAIVICSLAFMMVVLSFFVNNYLAHDKETSLKKYCNSISELVFENNLNEAQFISFINYAAPSISRTNEFEVLVSNSFGKPIFCSCEYYSQNRICEHTQNNIPERIFNNTIKQENYFEIGNFDNNFKTGSYTYGKVINYRNSNNFSIIFAYTETSNTAYFLLNIIKMFLMASLATIVVMFFAVFYTTYRLTKPLKLMAQASRCMACGDFSHRIPVTTDDEVGELAMAFNNMTDSLVKLESTRRSFVANVSHELKTPMTTIGGFIDGIIDGTIPEEKRNDYLVIVSDEVKRLSRLVQSMLSLAKLESGEMKIKISEFDLCKTVIDIVFAQQQNIENKNININGLDTIEKSVVSADKDLIHQAVYNLIDNAVKFTPTNGEITFNIYKDEQQNTHFLIKNTGVGIAQKDIPYIFERFYKVDRSRSAVKDSTGLGLYIVKTIIDIHSGQITVRSAENIFTEFDFYIPEI